MRGVGWLAAIEGNDEDYGDAGAEALRWASVLRPLVQAYLSRTGSLESGIRSGASVVAPRGSALSADRQ